MLPTATFARIGAFLDGPPQTLRSLLGAMNERRMMRGIQQMDLPLMTVYGDTNKDPSLYIKRNPDSWAVLDRILFIGQLSFLDTPDDVGAMVRRFQNGTPMSPVRTIDAEIMEQLSQYIVIPQSLITDPTIIDTYAAAACEYREERRKLPDEVKEQFILPDISDRRICIASQMLEAEAVLSGASKRKPKTSTPLALRFA